MPPPPDLYTVSIVAMPAGVMMPAGVLSEIHLPADSLLAALALSGTSIHSIRQDPRKNEIVIEIFTADKRPVDPFEGPWFDEHRKAHPTSTTQPQESGTNEATATGHARSEKKQTVEDILKPMFERETLP